MDFFQVGIYVLTAIALILGLLLSNAGSTGGLAAISGHDLEIFKKTKDYGAIRVMRIIMFMSIILIIIFAIIRIKS